MKLHVPNPLFFVILCFFAMSSSKAQNAKLKILLNYDRFDLNDTLDFTAIYTLGEKKLPPATLALVMKENNGNGIWQLRWPMIDGRSQAKLTFPRNIRRGNYTLYFAVEPRFFRLSGKVLYPKNVKTLAGNFLFHGILFKPVEIPVTNGSFEISNEVANAFVNSVVFSLDIPEKKNMPAIVMDAWLDSLFQPAAAISQEITIGMGNNSLIENKKDDNWLAYFDPFYRTSILKNLTPIQQFDSAYVSASFKKDAFQQFDFLSDSSLLKSGSLEKFLNKYYPNFKMNVPANDYELLSAHSKNLDFYFCVNEKPVTAETLGNLRLTDIATIKILPPSKYFTLKIPLHANIVALYTKQGPFCGIDYYRYSYIINGYQASFYQLPPSPKMFATSPYSF